MAERENLPVVIAAQALAVLSERRGSLVGRGLVALRKDNDALYRQARAVFDRSTSWHVERSWDAADNPAISSAFKIFQQLANENFGKAYYPLSILYGGKQDIEEGQDRAQHFAQLAFNWCFANQTNQDVELWCNLGEMYYMGHGVPQDYEEGVKWFLLAAERGNVIAQFNLWWWYSIGSGGPEDYGKTLKWCRLAAEQGDAFSQYYLGQMYRYGDDGAPQDDEEAVKWNRLAAEQGQGDAQEALRKLGIDWNK